MIHRRSFFAASAVLLAACAGGRGALGSADAAVQARIRALADEIVARQRLVGAQYAVLHHGAIIAEGATGLADIDAGAPVTPETMFLIASVTKSMTAAVAMRLAERGALDLDAPVQRYVPDFPAHPDGAVTARLLINHLGGIRHYDRAAGEPTPQMVSVHYDTATAALGVFRANPYAQAPNVGFHYTSYGYALLAAMMESASGRNFTQLLNEEVFAPLALERMHVPDMRYPIPGLAASYSFFDRASGNEIDTMVRARANDYSYNPGGGNVIANARSLAAYGRGFGQQGYLGAQAWSLLVTDPVERREIAEGRTYARDVIRYGWFLSHDNAGRVMLLSSGSSEAYQAGLLVYPDEDLSIAVLTNTWGVGSRDAAFTFDLPAAIGEVVLSA